MKKIDCTKLINSLTKLIAKANVTVDTVATTKLRECLAKETAPHSKWALEQIVDNIDIATKTNSPACQDTGMAVFFVKLGQNVRIKGGLLTDAINQAIRLAYVDNYFRLSIADPLTRTNTGDNTPAIIHIELVDGDTFEIDFLAKGAGAENMSSQYMLRPGDGNKGIISAVIDCVKSAGSNPCPPIAIGIGIGGNMEASCILAKKALLRIGEPHNDTKIATLENDILTAVNALNIGAMGFGGNSTAYGVAIETYPTHIGMLPIAINLQCHSARHFRLVM
ncbi:MAG: fumarate hydratase [Firmicutes bacterium]|nr:fumarate hydratase [Bacillota bacterium]